MEDLSVARSKFRRLFSAVRVPRQKKSMPNDIQKVLRAPRTSQLLPSLPPELWILILRYATSFPSTRSQSHSALDPLSLSPSYSQLPTAVSFLSFPHSHSHLQHRLSHYRSVMRQKVGLTLVCKAWSGYAREILFEFVWISRASQAHSLASTLLNNASVDKGNYIRRLHIETSPLERCCPADLRIILDYAPRLVVYSDYRSVRRNFYEESENPRYSPEQLFSALAHPNNSLRRLSWTNYDDVSFYIHMSPILETTAANLEFLELNFCSTHLHSVTSLSAALSSSTGGASLTLPALRSLKVALDNATFSILSTWSMPLLQNLSVLSADFSYAGQGFSQFFVIHGPKLTQLELGHSTSTIEEHYLTEPPNVGNSTRNIPLAEWCPNLKEFICSADAEWNWQNPDWIAPHVLLPMHSTLQLIGIRDIDKRLRDDIALSPTDDEGPFFMLAEQIGSLLRREAFPSLLYIRDMSWGSDLMRRNGGGVVGTVQGSMGNKVLRFWMSVLESCREGGVWLEDCRGVNVTGRDLRRAGADIQASEV